MTTEEGATPANGNGEATAAAPKDAGSPTPDKWDAERLQHHDKPGEPPSPPPKPTLDDNRHHRFSLRNLVRPAHKKDEELHPLDWGMPGELTKEEVDIFMKFRDEVEKRGGEFRNTVYNFTEEEGEAFALCRWLRARKYKYDDVIKMVEEATECRKDAGKMDFYPDPNLALGCDPSIFIAQYPQLYSGYAKNKAPLFISKPGVLNVDGLECVTTLEGMIKYHWHVMIHDFTRRLLEVKRRDPEFVRFECVCILDLNHLTSAQLSSRALNVVKQQTHIDSLCFPETMSRMVIVNAPRLFSMTWRLIKGWIDPRTASKVDLISSPSHWKKRLLELVDEDQLPSDYGGKGPDTNFTMIADAPGGMKKQFTELMTVRSHASHVVTIDETDELEVQVFTRGSTGATFCIMDKDKKNAKPLVEGVDVIHNGDGSNHVSEAPTKVILTQSRIVGPAHLKIKADSKSGRFSGSENFLIVCSIFPKK